ncbi:MAG: poly(R)-hydroxyalkanoic acid synthase subunit PhaE [Desulforhopalus sp.]
MADNEKDPLGLTSLVDTWIKSISDLWGNLGGYGDGSQQYPSPWAITPGKKYSSSKAQATMSAALKNWQSMAGAMTTPDSISALLKGTGAMPEMLLRFAQTSLNGYWQMQQNSIERLGRMNTVASAYEFDDIEENVFRMWTDMYEKEFKQFFLVPQLGLMRTYQEKANQAIDKYNLFQSTLSEFLGLLSLPFNRSMRVMQENLTEMTENGSLPDDTREYYNMWVKVLEGHFMTLFQTPEYVETLTRTINALTDFTAARDSVLEDLLGSFPIATQRDVDDMARELYELKRRLRKLEKENK